MKLYKYIKFDAVSSTLLQITIQLWKFQSRCALMHGFSNAPPPNLRNYQIRKTKTPRWPRTRFFKRQGLFPRPRRVHLLERASLGNSESFDLVLFRCLFIYYAFIMEARRGDSLSLFLTYLFLLTQILSAISVNHAFCKFCFFIFFSSSFLIFSVGSTAFVKNWSFFHSAMFLINGALLFFSPCCKLSLPLFGLTFMCQPTTTCSIMSFADNYYICCIILQIAKRLLLWWYGKLLSHDRKEWHCCCLCCVFMVNEWLNG